LIPKLVGFAEVKIIFIDSCLKHETEDRFLYGIILCRADERDFCCEFLSLFISEAAAYKSVHNQLILHDIHPLFAFIGKF